MDNGGQLVATDRYVLSERIEGGFRPGLDEISIDGIVVQILGVQRFPEAGEISAMKFFVRG